MAQLVIQAGRAKARHLIRTLYIKWNLTVLLNKDNFYKTVEHFTDIPTKITEISEECFRSVYSSEEASKNKNIVYLLRSQKPVPRLSGESDILYIGQTKHSIKRRYLPYARLQATSEANEAKFTHILEMYGNITVSFDNFSAYGDSLLMAEGQLLWWYFQNHFEYPPMNYTKTKVRNGAINV